MIAVASLFVILTWLLHWPWWAPLAAVWAFWLVMLPVFTWRDYLAGMNFWRVKRGNWIAPPAPDEFGNEPDAERALKWLLWLPGNLHNFCTNAIWATVYFRDPPRLGEWGLTMRLNRYVNGPASWRKDRALAIRKRWLNRYDPRGVHT